MEANWKVSETRRKVGKILSY